MKLRGKKWLAYWDDSDHSLPADWSPPTSAPRSYLLWVGDFTSCLLGSLLPCCSFPASPVAALSILPSNILWLTLPMCVSQMPMSCGLPFTWTLKWSSDWMLNIAVKMNYCNWAYERSETANNHRQKKERGKKKSALDFVSNSLKWWVKLFLWKLYLRDINWTTAANAKIFLIWC